MKNLRYGLVGISFVLAVFSCSKNNREISAPVSVADLLTAKPWKLVSFGFDTNKNGMVDLDEESIPDCMKDNTYWFKKDGSGIVYENSNICNGNAPTTHFKWMLTQNDTVLDFHTGYAYIQRITADSLYTADSKTNPEKLLAVYGR